MKTQNEFQIVNILGKEESQFVSSSRLFLSDGTIFFVKHRILCQRFRANVSVARAHGKMLSSRAVCGSWISMRHQTYNDHSWMTLQSFKNLRKHCVCRYVDYVFILKSCQIWSDAWPHVLKCFMNLYSILIFFQIDWRFGFDVIPRFPLSDGPRAAFWHDRHSEQRKVFVGQKGKGVAKIIHVIESLRMFSQ